MAWSWLRVAKSAGKERHAGIAASIEITLAEKDPAAHVMARLSCEYLAFYPQECLALCIASVFQLLAYSAETCAAAEFDASIRRPYRAGISGDLHLPATMIDERSQPMRKASWTPPTLIL